MRTRRASALFVVPFLLTFGQQKTLASTIDEVTPDMKGDTFHYGLNRIYPARTDLDYLEQIIKKAKSDKSLHIRIISHGCSIGTDEANMKVSEQRAKILLKYIQKRGIPSDRIELKWKGESEPIASNHTQHGRAINRRSLIQLIRLNKSIAQGVQKPKNQIAITAPEPKENFKEPSYVSGKTLLATVPETTIIYTSPYHTKPLIITSPNTNAEEVTAPPISIESDEEKYELLATQISKKRKQKNIYNDKNTPSSPLAVYTQNSSENSPKTTVHSPIEKEEENVKNNLITPRKNKTQTQVPIEPVQENIAAKYSPPTETAILPDVQQEVKQLGKILRFVDADTGLPIQGELKVKTGQKHDAYTTNSQGEITIPSISKMQENADFYVDG